MFWLHDRLLAILEAICAKPMLRLRSTFGFFEHVESTHRGVSAQFVTRSLFLPTLYLHKLFRKLSNGLLKARLKHHHRDARRKGLPLYGVELLDLSFDSSTPSEVSKSLGDLANALDAVCKQFSRFNEFKT